MQRSILIYNGTEMEGTPFENVWARGVNIVEMGAIVEVDNCGKRGY